MKPAEQSRWPANWSHTHRPSTTRARPGDAEISQRPAATARSTARSRLLSGAGIVLVIVGPLPGPYAFSEEKDPRGPRHGPSRCPYDRVDATGRTPLGAGPHRSRAGPVTTDRPLVSVLMAVGCL